MNSQVQINRRLNVFKSKYIYFLDKIGIIVIVLLLCVFFALMNEQFLDEANIMNVFRQTSINAILAAGMTFVILTGGIDLSVGAIIALTGVVSAYLVANTSVPAPLAVLSGIMVGGVAGYINGILTSVTKLPPIMVTLGSMTYLRGIAYVITGGYPLVVANSFFKQIGIGYVGPIPIPVIIMIVVYILSHIVLKYTVFGRNVYMIGGNEEAARLTGIKVVSRVTWVYTISGICAGIAGVILAARMYSGQPNAGTGYELDAIAAVVLGGTSLVGGVGLVVGSLFGALFMSILSNGLTLMNVEYYWQLIIKGIVIILAIYVDHVRRKKTK
ncbi:branched-chain amino acid transport system / permease component family protein [Anoxybacillus sp. B7M1]|jgi:ribose transport system permease protein|uniref:ABC transporter permease n=1 Tax=unclassified Anoxybacillus TaxID=2639704 RepID=UPI0005CC9F79|nr:MULTISPECIES: ABC transporter permease [unclassified Anoxybacillus]ANB56017.1 branched-chain amino acid transport system / permease component family protein [Anoxybacillus sp. B2M1]ANB64665.1 branched-chain amino acid transport system / permease component family protein [Anoxybacillus sp. B7M1]